MVDTQTPVRRPKQIQRTSNSQNWLTLSKERAVSCTLSRNTHNARRKRQGVAAVMAPARTSWG